MVSVAIMMLPLSLRLIGSRRGWVLVCVLACSGRWFKIVTDRMRTSLSMDLRLRLGRHGSEGRSGLRRDD